MIICISYSYNAYTVPNSVLLYKNGYSVGQASLANHKEVTSSGDNFEHTGVDNWRESWLYTRISGKTWGKSIIAYHIAGFEL